MRKGGGSVRIMRQKTLIAITRLLIFVVIAMILLVFMSSHPLDVSPDSTVYIETVHNLASGNGLIDDVLRMEQNEIATLRQHAIDYYDHFLDLGPYAQKLIE